MHWDIERAEKLYRTWFYDFVRIKMLIFSIPATRKAEKEGSRPIMNNKEHANAVKHSLQKILCQP